MICKCRHWYRRIHALRWLSPGCFLLCAVSCAAIFFALHAAGWRERTAVLCGMLPSDRNAQVMVTFQAVLYTFFYLATIIVSPILTIAAVVFSGLLGWGRRRGALQIQESGSRHLPNGASGRSD